MFACYTKWEEEEKKGRSKKGERWQVACNEGATAASAPLPSLPLCPLLLLLSVLLMLLGSNSSNLSSSDVGSSGINSINSSSSSSFFSANENGIRHPVNSPPAAGLCGVIRGNAAASRQKPKKKPLHTHTH